MDGVPGVTQQPIRPGGTMAYEFALAHPGTYWPIRMSTPSSTAGCAPLIVEDRSEPGRYDTEFVVVLDDWLDGTGRDPDRVQAGLKAMSA